MIDSNDDTELREAIELLYRGYRSFTSGPDRILEKRGLNRAHHRILYFVGRNSGLSVNDLLNVLQVSKQALHIPLRQLVSMNLVKNSRATHDRRVRKLQLSSSGRRLEARLTGSQQYQLQEIFNAAGPDAEDAWREIMQALAVY